MAAPSIGFVTRAMLGAIRLYQLLISPFFGQVCRFHPSCSRYTAECLCLHGPLKGSYLGLRRLLRCHPFHPGGIDFPPAPTPPAKHTTPENAPQTVANRI